MLWKIIIRMSLYGLWCYDVLISWRHSYRTQHENAKKSQDVNSQHRLHTTTCILLHCTQLYGSIMLHAHWNITNRSNGSTFWSYNGRECVLCDIDQHILHVLLINVFCIYYWCRGIYMWPGDKKRDIYELDQPQAQRRRLRTHQG